ncbi:MAG: L,D-transpeptidase [Blastochloris sp.]|nr:L,D-transpeptidase [Blastochloris sp.]
MQVTISIPQQLLEVFHDGECVFSVPCSSSQFGLGTEEGSYRTPTGRFHIAEKIGQGQPLGAIFQSRQPTGQLWSPDNDSTEEDLILTRILWLAGDEPHNANTQSRYIYLHGTNHEDRIGSPSSHGCIRLRNRDMMELFDLVEVLTPVHILP